MSVPAQGMLSEPVGPAASTASACVVSPSAEERADGAPCWGGGGSSSGTFVHAARTFLSSGCCVIPEALPQDFTQSCRERATRDRAFLEAELQARRGEISASSSSQPSSTNMNHHLAASVHRCDFAELVKRDGGRLDVRFQMHKGEYVAPGLVYNPLVFPLVKALLGGGDVNLLYAGVMWAKGRPDQTAQRWHADGGHLFTENGHQPPHCINVFYPLIDLTPDHGPTEFMPGTHRLGNFNGEGGSGGSGAGAVLKTGAAQPAFGLCCRAGGCIMFDYRIKHRGGANITSEDRPILYLAYGKPWFRDTGNLRSGKSVVGPHAGVVSAPWAARVLRGAPMPMGRGFSVRRDAGSLGEVQAASAPASSSAPASGEQWVLFEMDVELDSGVTAPLTARYGDVAAELSAQFCIEHGLADSFVPVLTTAVQQQIDACLATRC